MGRPLRYRNATARAAERRERAARAAIRAATRGGAATSHLTHTARSSEGLGGLFTGMLQYVFGVHDGDRTHPSHEERWLALADHCHPSCAEVPIEECCEKELKLVERSADGRAFIETNKGLGLRQAIPSLSIGSGGSSSEEEAAGERLLAVRSFVVRVLGFVARGAACASLL